MVAIPCSLPTSVRRVESAIEVMLKSELINELEDAVVRVGVTMESLADVMLHLEDIREDIQCLLNEVKEDQYQGGLV